jgi:beta-glucosidase
MPVTFDAAGEVSGALFARGWGLDYRSTVNSPRLSEDPRIPPHWVASRGSLFHAGHVVAPWSIFVADDSAEVHFTTARQESPRGSVVVASESDGSAIVWAGAQSGMFTISGRAGDMRPQAAQGLAIDVRYRVDRAPAQPVKIGLRCTEPLCGTQGGAMLDVTQVFKNAQPGNWRTLSIPLSCFAAAGADLAQVVVPFAVETSGPFGLTISEVRLAPRTSGPSPKCLGTI